MLKCLHCGERHVTFESWKVCAERQEREQSRPLTRRILKTWTPGPWTATFYAGVRRSAKG